MSLFELCVARKPTFVQNMVQKCKLVEIISGPMSFISWNKMIQNLQAIIMKTQFG
jgi:hypothetical protein